jgi:hypothetical protein
MDDRSLIVLVVALLLFLAILVFIVAYLFQPIPVQSGAPAMIGLFIKRGWFWELVFYIAILELAHVIGGH